MELKEIFGFIAGAIGVYMAVPQALQIRRTGQSYGVSLTFWMVLLLVNSSWLAYGFVINSPSIIVSNVAGFTTSAMVVSAILQRGLWLWPAMYAAGSAWLWLFQLLPMWFITIFLVALTFSRMPQLAQSVRNLRAGIATDVSMRSQWIGLTSMLMWEGYSLVSGHSQLVITTTIALTLTVTVIWLELATRAKANLLEAIEVVDGPQG